MDRLDCPAGELTVSSPTAAAVYAQTLWEVVERPVGLTVEGWRWCGWFFGVDPYRWGHLFT